MSLAGLIWRCAASLAAPLLPLYLRRRAARGKEIAARLPERRGAHAARPPGPLLWLHAASVGETLSVLPVLEALAARAPRLTVLLTTGTVTGAALLDQRLPAGLRGRVLHRFVPLDVPRWVARFLDGWRPDAGAIVESELWPNLIAAARARRIPLALVNGRFSARSARRWRHAAGLGREVMEGFALVLAQSSADAGRFAALGARAVRAPGNLKDAAAPLPAAPEALAALRAAIGGRPVLLGASTHPGEEAILLAAHRLLAEEFPGLLTLLAPRHPERGPALAALAAEHALPAARRAAGELPGPQTAVYVADTLGELGLFYRLASVGLVGGSLVPHGGQIRWSRRGSAAPSCSAPGPRISPNRSAGCWPPVARCNWRWRRRGCWRRRPGPCYRIPARAAAWRKPPPRPSRRRPACRMRWPPRSCG